MIIWVADKITYYSQWTWQKLVVPYRLRKFSHLNLNIHSSTHYFSILLMLSVTHISSSIFGRQSCRCCADARTGNPAVLKRSEGQDVNDKHVIFIVNDRSYIYKWYSPTVKKWSFTSLYQLAIPKTISHGQGPWKRRHRRQSLRFRDCCSMCFPVTLIACRQHRVIIL